MIHLRSLCHAWLSETHLMEIHFREIHFKWMTLQCLPVKMQSRLCADPHVGVRDLQQCVVTFLKGQASRDLLSILSAGRSHRVDWKSSPVPGVLGCPEVGQLYKILFRCCQNGVISKSKLKSALWATQNEFSRMNLQPKHDSDYMDALDERIRVLDSHFRDLKRCEEKYCRLMRKATEQEKKEVDEVLAELKLEVEQPAEPSRPASSSSCVALVPYVAHEKKADAVQSQEEKALRIFQRVLSRQEASPEKLPVVKVASSGQRQLQQRISDASEESLTFLHEALGDAEEKSKVKKAKRSSGVQKLRAEACQRSMDLSEEEVAFLQNAFEEKVDISKKVKKRPASAAAPQKKRKTEETKKRVPKQKAAVSVQSSPMKKSSKRRRVRDSAYHKAKRLARINGFSPGSACRKASEAAAKAAKAFDEAHWCVSAIWQEKRFRAMLGTNACKLHWRKTDSLWKDSLETDSLWTDSL